MKIFSLINSLVKNPEVYKFTIVGACAATTVLTITWLLSEFLDIFYAYSVAIAFELTFTWGFFVHDKWTFKDHPKKFSLIQRFFRYHLIGFSALGVNEAFLLFFTIVFQLHYLFSEFLAIILTFGFNYFMNKKFAWGIKFEVK